MTREEAKQILLNRGFVNGIFDGNKWREAVIVISNGLEDIKKLPNAEKIDGDLVPKSIFDQIKWERDVAISQLHDLGYELGEKPRKEKTAEWIREHSVTYSGSFWHIECSNCHKESEYLYDFCPNCGAKMKGVE